VKVLVTGATGFAGSHLVRALAAAGHTVRALVRPGKRGARLASTGIEIVTGQLTDAADVRNAAAGCERIYHLAAAFRNVKHSDQHYWDVNVGGTLNVLAAARAHGCERVVHCSTGGVHGHIEDPPAAETYRFQPGDVYQRTKLEAELAVAAAANDGLSITIVRPGAIYGEGDMRFLRLFRAIQQQRFAMVGSGETRLHMVHVDDLVRGMLLAGSRAEACGEIFLLAGPEVPTLNEIAASVADAVGARRPKLHIPVWPVYAAAWLCEKACAHLCVEPPLHRRRVGFFTHHREFDISKARKLIDYEPRVRLTEGVRRTAAWYAAAGLLAPLKVVAVKAMTLLHGVMLTECNACASYMLATV
jgi:nucleoside-diphosphate-sugar epimerase